jgi:hypothetical protein
MDRRKELKEQYKNFKPDMGVFIISSNYNNKCYVEEAKDLKSKINRAKFQLEFGNHPNKELQKEWKEHGEKYFTIEILEKLKYDKDESKTDYTEDLALLKMIWKEKLLQNNIKFYKS